MAIIVTVNTANDISTILNVIKQGFIPTWQMDMDGDITLTHIRWVNKAWFRINVDSNRMVFGIVGSRRYPLTNELYGVFHGRLVSTLLAYFNQRFQSFEIDTKENQFDLIN